MVSYLPCAILSLNSYVLLLQTTQELSNLRFLYIEGGNPDNPTTGTIPSEYGNLSNLLVLDIDKNNLTGTIPNEIYNLFYLEQLDINLNSLTGKISPQISGLTNLRYLQVSQNLFTGEIPKELGSLNRLGKQHSAEEVTEIFIPPSY